LNKAFASCANSARIQLASETVNLMGIYDPRGETEAE
jgi:hypothetical protein